MVPRGPGRSAPLQWGEAVTLQKAATTPCRGLNHQSWLCAGAPLILSDAWVYKDPNGQLQVRKLGRTCACCLVFMAQLPGTHAPLQSRA